LRSMEIKASGVFYKNDKVSGKEHQKLKLPIMAVLKGKTPVFIFIFL